MENRVTVELANSRLFRTLLLVLTIIASIFLLGQVGALLGQFSDLILILFLAWLLSFVLDPWVHHVTDLGLPRGLAGAVVYLLVAGIITMSGLIFIPLLADQTSSFIYALALTSQNPPDWVKAVQSFLNSSGVSIDLYALAKQQIAEFQHFSASTLSQTVNLATSILGILFNAFLVLLFSFYFVLDGDRFWKAVLAHLPERVHKEAEYVKNAISLSFAGFMRTQVLLGLLMGASTFLVLWGMGVDYAVTAATFSGISMIIPVLGPFLAVIPATLVALVTVPTKALIIFLAVFILQLVIVNIIGPLLFRRSVGLHPVLVLVSFIVGYKLFGWWGSVFAVPVAGVLLIIGSQLLRHWVGPNRSAREFGWPL